MHLRYNEFAEPLYRGTAHDFVVIEGGRGAAKTFEVTQALSYRGHIEPLRICVAREHLKSIHESAKTELEERMSSMGLLRRDSWSPKLASIDHHNGSRMFFIGLSRVSEEDIKGLAQVDILWIEEAHRMSRSSWELIRPTIRKDGSQIWASYNPKNRDDPIYEFAQRNVDNPRVLFMHVTWRDNAFFTARNERERQESLEYEPDRYQHIWEGVPDDAGDVRRVITYEQAQACMEAWEKWAPANNYEPRGRICVGLDMADTGDDSNALVARRGPLIFHGDRWSGLRRVPRGRTPDEIEDEKELKSRFTDTLRRADRYCRDHGVWRMWYDAGGIGGPARAILREVDGVQGRAYRRRGVHFGGKVEGAEVLYDRRHRNEDYFHRRNSQLAWALHLRVMRTLRLLDGDRKVKPEHCLFIDRSGIRDPTLFLNQLTQPEWEENTSGKIVIDKQPKEAEGSTSRKRSPDYFDASVLGFARDSESGLKARAA